MLPPAGASTGLTLVKFNGVHVYLNVENVEKSRAFYEGLGFKMTRQFPEMDVYAFRVGASNFVIGPADAPGDDAAVAWLRHKPWGVGVVLMPGVDSADAVYEKAKAIGADIEQPPMDQPWGSRTVSIADPDGYSLMFEEDLEAKRSARRAPLKSAKKAARKAPAKKAGAKKAGAKKAGAKKAGAKKTAKKTAKKATRRR